MQGDLKANKDNLQRVTDEANTDRMQLQTTSSLMADAMQQVQCCAMAGQLMLGHSVLCCVMLCYLELCCVVLGHAMVRWAGLGHAVL